MSNKCLEIRRANGTQKNFCVINRSRLKDPILFDFQRSMGDDLYSDMSKTFEDTSGDN